MKIENEPIKRQTEETNITGHYTNNHSAYLKIVSFSNFIFRCKRANTKNIIIFSFLHHFLETHQETSIPSVSSNTKVKWKKVYDLELQKQKGEELVEGEEDDRKRGMGSQWKWDQSWAWD